MADDWEVCAPFFPLCASLQWDMMHASISKVRVAQELFMG